MEISDNCYRFAEHLFSHASDHALNASHESSDAPAADLSTWQIDAAEWAIAWSIAAQARWTKRKPSHLLAKMESFFNNARLDSKTGRAVYRLNNMEVGGSAPRKEGGS